MHFTPARRLGVALFISTLLHAATLLSLSRISEAVHRFPVTALAPILQVRLQGEIVTPQWEEGTKPVVQEESAPLEAVRENIEKSLPLPAETPPAGKVLQEEKKLQIPIADPARCSGTGPIYSYQETEAHPYLLRGISPQADPIGENRPTGRIVLQLCIAEDGRIWNAILIDSELPSELAEKLRLAYLDALFSPGRIAQKPVKTAIIIVGGIE